MGTNKRPPVRLSTFGQLTRLLAKTPSQKKAPSSHTITMCFLPFPLTNFPTSPASCANPRMLFRRYESYYGINQSQWPRPRRRSRYH